MNAAAPADAGLGEWLVFSRNPTAARHELARSKRGVWWARADSEKEAAELRSRLGSGAWIATIPQMRRRPQQRYAKPTRAELVAHEAERRRALKDFEAGCDWPPWEDGLLTTAANDLYNDIIP